MRMRKWRNPSEGNILPGKGKMGMAKHILVVDDEHHLAVGIQFNLEQEGFRVTTVGDGPKALELLLDPDQKVDLLVLDLMLPGMSGYAICERLREAGLEIPVLMLSARTLSEDRTRGFEVGADQYLTKPFELDELIARIKRLLNRSPTTAAPKSSPQENGTYEFGRVEVDFDSYEVRVEGKPVRLTNREIQLLRYFVVNEGRVISRDEILENVWGYNIPPATRSVDNFIMRLRRALEIDPANPNHFHSVRGAGYRFISDPDDSEPE